MSYAELPGDGEVMGALTSAYRLFTTGQGSRERREVKICPHCGSGDLIYNQREATKDVVRCGRCRRIFSKASTKERSQNRY